MTTESPIPENKITNENDTGPVLTLIKQIKENKVDPLVLSTEDRRRCVGVLWGEGYTVAETAQILKRGERTIFRDRSALRSTHALRIHPQFAPEMAGELMRQADCSAGRLRRIARESGASALRLPARQTDQPGQESAVGEPGLSLGSKLVDASGALGDLVGPPAPP